MSKPKSRTLLNSLQNSDRLASELSMGARAVGASWWSFWEIAARTVIQFLVLVILARILAPSDFGLVAMIVVFTAIGALLVDSGFSTALIQRQRTTDDDETTVFIFSITAGALLSLLLWWAAPWIARFYSQDELIPLTRAMAVILPFYALACVPDALLALKLDFRTRARAEFFASSLAGVFAIWLAWSGFGVWSLIGQAVLLIATRTILLWLYTGWRPRGRFRLASFKTLFAFGGYILISRMLDTVSIRLQSLLIGRLFDSRTLGLYTIAQNTQDAPASFLAALLNRVGLPVFSAVANDTARLKNALRLSLNVTMFLFVPGMIGLAVVAEPLVILLYGSRWEAAASILSILALSAVFWPLHVLNLAALTAMGRSDLFLRLTIIKKIILIALILSLSVWGPLGVASAVLLSSLMALFINTWHTGQLLDFGLREQLAELRLTFALSLLSSLTTGLIIWRMDPGYQGLVLGIGLAIMAYLGMAALLKHSAIGRMRQILDEVRTSGGEQ